MLGKARGPKPRPEGGAAPRLEIETGEEYRAYFLCAGGHCFHHKTTLISKRQSQSKAAQWADENSSAQALCITTDMETPLSPSMLSFLPFDLY